MADEKPVKVRPRRTIRDDVHPRFATIAEAESWIRQQFMVCFEPREMILNEVPYVGRAEASPH